MRPSRTTKRITPRTAIGRSLTRRAQRVRGAHAVALGDDIFDLVAQPRHRRQEAGQALAVLVDADATAAQRGGVLVDEVVGDERGDRVGVAGGERLEVADDSTSAGDCATRHEPLPQTSCALA